MATNIYYFFSLFYFIFLSSFPDKNVVSVFAINDSVANAEEWEMFKRFAHKHGTDVVFIKGKIFSDCRLYISKANLSKTRFSLLENKILLNDGIVIDELSDPSITHVLVEDTLTKDSNNCFNILRKEGLSVSAPTNFKILSLEWVCECLKQKKQIDTKRFEIKLPSIQPNATDKQSSANAENTETDAQPPETKRSKTDNIDHSQYTCSQVAFNETTLIKNVKIIDELQQLADAFRSQGDKWRAYSYEKAVRAIKNYNKTITSYEEVTKLPGIGQKMALKVKEILEEGHLRKVDEVCNGEKNKVIELFSGVWGAGPATTLAWYNKGYRTLEDLKTKAELTHQQKVGLKYYYDFKERIPRSQVEEIAEIVKEKTLKFDKSLKVVICGSYRRGKPSCGDIDIVIIRPEDLNRTNILYYIHKDLKETNIITDDLTTLDVDGDDKKYLGVCKLPGENRKYRRLDLFVVPESESATALMHCTGSALFNRSIRLLAAHKGMCLSEHALSTNVTRVGPKVTNIGDILPTPTEESIFQHLGLEYRPPSERDH